MIYLGILPFFQAIMLLAFSFFVLFAASKTESKNLKSFGRIIAASFWVIACAVIIISIYLNVTGLYLLGAPRLPFKYHRMMR